MLAKYVERLLAAARASVARLAAGYDEAVSTEAPNSVFATVEEAIEDIRAGPLRRRRRRRGPRERGRSHDRRPVRDARGGQLHGDARPRPDLPLPDARAVRGARSPADDRPERDAVRHRLHRLDRGARGRLDRASRPPTARARSRSRSTRPRRPTTSSSPGTSSRSAPARAASSSARARPRRPSTSRGSPGSLRRASSARS